MRSSGSTGAAVCSIDISEIGTDIDLQFLKGIQQGFQRQADDVRQAALDLGDENTAGPLHAVTACFTARLPGFNVPFQVPCDIRNERHGGARNSLGGSVPWAVNTQRRQSQVVAAGIKG